MFSMILIIVSELIVLHFIPINGKIINVNVTYGPQGKFVREMIMVPKREYEEFRIEFQKMEDDNLHLVKQISALRARPLSYYENEAKKLESEISYEVAETTTKISNNKFKTTSQRRQTIKTVTNIPKHELNTTIFVKDVETKTTTTEREFQTTIPIAVVEVKTNNSGNRFNTTKFNRLIKTTTNNVKQEPNASVNLINQQLKEKNRLNNVLQKEINNLKKERNATNDYMFHFKWKMLIVQTVDDYENEFDQLEVRNVTPPFRLNRTLLNETIDSWKFDRLAEQRRQRWEFYLRTSPYCDNNFEHLVKRIVASKFTVEEFCRALAILYKLVSLDSHLEIIKPAKITCGSLSHYHKYHFVISMLLIDYPKTELIENIFNELKP